MNITPCKSVMVSPLPDVCVVANFLSQGFSTKHTEILALVRTSKRLDD
jgi:hypothetical protein